MGQVGFSLATYLFWPLKAFISKVLILLRKKVQLGCAPKIQLSVFLPPYHGPEEWMREPSGQASQAGAREQTCRAPLTTDFFRAADTLALPDGSFRPYARLSEPVLNLFSSTCRITHSGSLPPVLH